MRWDSIRNYLHEAMQSIPPLDEIILINSDLKPEPRMVQGLMCEALDHYGDSCLQQAWALSVIGQPLLTQRELEAFLSTAYTLHNTPDLLSRVA